MIDKDDPFVGLVRSLREYQKAFFRTHDQAALQASKTYERLVDKMRAERFDPAGQTTLGLEETSDAR